MMYKSYICHKICLKTAFKATAIVVQNSQLLLAHCSLGISLILAVIASFISQIVRRLL